MARSRHRPRVHGDTFPIGLGGRIPTLRSDTSPPLPQNYYLYEEWESGSRPAPWLESKFFPTGVTISYTDDPLGQRGKVLEIEALYAGGAVSSSYSNSILQQGSVYVVDANAYSGYQTINEESWYRIRHMAPTGNRFCNALSNWIIEWHNDGTTGGYSGAYSPGVCWFGGEPQTTSGTTTPYMLLRWMAGPPTAPVSTYWPSSGTGGWTQKVGSIPFVPDHWYDIVFHVIWSTSAATGRVRWWVDDTLIIDKTMQTLYYPVPGNFNSASNNDFGVYNYRYRVTGDSWMYFDTMAIGPTAASIGFVP